jgi:hypothetical protein
MPKLKSARHHWWPQCVSSYWAGDDGLTGRLKPDGTSTRIPPKHLGVIRNAHHIRFASTPGESSHFDSSFESEFDKADNNFPRIISWLESLEREFIEDDDLRRRFHSQPASDELLRLLTECVVSLAVRSPMSREASVRVPEMIRGIIESPERERLIGCNMSASQRVVADSIGSRGKYAVVFSQHKEFIYGDGFFHNVGGVINRITGAKILAPITPRMSVAVTNPMSFRLQPQLTTIVLSDEEVDLCNHAVQVYSCQELFFRSHEPIVCDAFARNEHLGYSNPNNPIDSFIHSIPGMH